MFSFQGQTWRALVDMFIGHQVTPFRALRIPAEQTNIANKRSPFCIGNIFKTIDVQGFLECFYGHLYRDLFLQHSFKNKNHVEVTWCIESKFLLTCHFLSPKKTTKKHTKNSTWKTTRRRSKSQAGGGWLRQHLVGRHGVSDVFDVFYEPQRSGSADFGWFWEVPGFGFT